MNGLGAWSFGYYQYNMPVPNHRVARGIFAFKQELVYNGYTSGIVLSSEIFGNYVRDRTKEFQKANSIEVDGVIGPQTARMLFRKRSHDLEQKYQINNYYLTKLKSLESNNDPVAQGYVDVQDEGLVQLHMPYYTSLTLEDAWNPAVSLETAGRGLAELKTYTGSWDGAVAGWNIGKTYAKMWVDADYPASGGPTMGTDAHGNPIDSYVRATNYVKVVAASAV